jgi:sigma-B regulation protein RsbU (phosphoserine phosphatase)
VYSDGVSESMNAQSVLFGSEAIERCLRGAPLVSSDNVVKRIVASVQAHQGDAPQADDLTLLALRAAR